MSDPVSLRGPHPAHLQPPPARPRESDAQRKDRHLDLVRELTDLNMLAARDAAHRIVTREATQAEDAPAGADPTLALARATRSVTGLINVESRIAAGETAPAPANDDPRGLALRKLLHPLVDGEPDLARRRALRNRVNEGIDDALGADLDDDLSLADIGRVIAQKNGLRLDMAKVRDNYLFPISDPACTNPNARLTPYPPDAPPELLTHPVLGNRTWSKRPPEPGRPPPRT